jgi:hypothetical protein
MANMLAYDLDNGGVAYLRTSAIVGILPITGQGHADSTALLLINGNTLFVEGSPEMHRDRMIHENGANRG